MFPTQALLLLHNFNGIIVYNNEEFPFMIHRACVNPHDLTNAQPFYKLMPLDTILCISYCLVIIYSNLYLSRFLR